MNQEEIKVNIMFNIAECRRVNGLTQENLSSILKVKRSRLGAWEEGRSTPSFEMIVKIVDFFGKDLRGFMIGRMNSGGLM